LELVHPRLSMVALHNIRGWALEYNRSLWG